MRSTILLDFTTVVKNVVRNGNKKKCYINFLDDNPQPRGAAKREAAVPFTSRNFKKIKKVFPRYMKIVAKVFNYILPNSNCYLYLLSLSKAYRSRT